MLPQFIGVLLTAACLRHREGLCCSVCVCVCVWRWGGVYMDAGAPWVDITQDAQGVGEMEAMLSVELANTPVIPCWHFCTHSAAS